MEVEIIKELIVIFLFRHTNVPEDILLRQFWPQVPQRSPIRDI